MVKQQHYTLKKIEHVKKNVFIWQKCSHQSNLQRSFNGATKNRYTKTTWCYCKYLRNSGPRQAMRPLNCLRCAAERTILTNVKCEFNRTQINTQHVVQKLLIRKNSYTSVLNQTLHLKVISLYKIPHSFMWVRSAKFRNMLFCVFDHWKCRWSAGEESGDPSAPYVECILSVSLISIIFCQRLA